MSAKTFFARQTDRLAKRFGYRVFPDWALHPSQLAEIDASIAPQGVAALPAGAAEYLHRGNSRLQELRKIHAGSDPQVKTPLVWTEKFAATPNLTAFRGDNAWINQLENRSLHGRAYVLATHYALHIDPLGIMEKFTEDGAFGALTFEVAGRCISRDMIDSVLEISFLDRHLSLASRTHFSVLDIGARYGRLAHRMLSIFPSLQKYYCADVIAEPSFVCEYYMRLRGLEERVELLSTAQLNRARGLSNVDLAITDHSFSECTLKAVDWWLTRLARYGIKNLMITPNAGDNGGQILVNNIGQDMLPTVERNGYRLQTRESKYSDPAVQRFAMNPTYYWLFRLEK